MFPILPIVSASIPQVIDVTFGLMPFAGAVAVLIVGAGEIARSLWSSRSKPLVSHAPYARAGAPRMVNAQS